MMMRTFGRVVWGAADVDSASQHRAVRLTSNAGVNRPAEKSLADILYFVKANRFGMEIEIKAVVYPVNSNTHIVQTAEAAMIYLLQRTNRVDFQRGCPGLIRKPAAHLLREF